MADRPILFSAPMIRALLAGTKTQTRRVLKPQPAYPFEVVAKSHREGLWWAKAGREPWLQDMIVLPFAPGDRLWVREAWNCFVFSQDGDDAWPTKKIPTDAEYRENKEEAVRFDMQVVYQESDRAREWFKDQPWRPSIHMPRWASRLTLTVTEVRVQRLQEVSEDDALAEGVEHTDGYWVREYDYVGRDEGAMIPNNPPVPAYAALWTSLHGPGSWEANPWVVAVSFEVSNSR